jgi:hypothetical protein
VGHVVAVGRHPLQADGGSFVGRASAHRSRSACGVAEPPKALGQRLARLEEEGAVLRRDGTVTLIKPIARRRGALRRFLASRA